MLSNPNSVPVSPESSDFKQRFSRLPKTDMHLHIEGSISLDEYREVVAVPDSWTPPGWAPDYRYESFKEFEDFILGYGDAWFSSPERYAISARSLFQRKMDEGVRYVECSFAAIISLLKALPVDEVVDAIRGAIPEGLEVRLFMGLHHDSWSAQTEKVLADALSLRGLDGIDLHGPERYPVRDWMLEYWPAARAAGKFTKAHAGELGPGWHVREAVEKLGVTRIEHGFNAVEDSSIVELLVERNVVLDVCPVSNYKLKSVPSYADHPLTQLIDAGVCCTINTDDPFIFGNTIDDDFEVLALHAGYPMERLIALARNGFEQALVDEATKLKLLSDFDAAAGGLNL